ncbi:MAG: hypothetical protein WDM88_10725 [Galbitalea sp.]
MRLNRTVTVRDGGRSLIGGSPTRVLYLTDLARELMPGDSLTVRDAASSALADRLLEAGMADPVLESLSPRR